MKVLVCGSRGWIDEGLVYELLGDLRDRYGDELEVIHGGADGADTMVDRACEDLEIRAFVFRPDYRFAKDRRAPILRNLRMLDDRPNLVLAFWDGKSRGTKMTMDEARARGIKVHDAGSLLREDVA